MKITQDQAQKMHRLGDALRQQILFDAIRRDDAVEVLAYLEANGSSSPDQLGDVLLETIDLAMTVALSFNAQKCLQHLLPRLPLEMLHGATLSRVVEKDQDQALQCIVDFAPLTQDQHHAQIDRAVFNSSPRVLDKLLRMSPMSPGFVDPYRLAVMRGAPKFECLAVLVQCAPSTPGCQEALLEAVVRNQANAINILLPHISALEACKEMLSMSPTYAPDVLATLDAFMDPRLDEKDVANLLPLIQSLPDAAMVPHLNARATQISLDQQTSPSPARPSGSRL